MTIRRQGGEIIIRIPDNIEIASLQRLVDFLVYSNVTSKSHATQDQVDELSSSINKSWWQNNQERFMNP